MIRKNLKSLLLTSLLTLFPIAAGLMLWEQLPGRIAIHWGAGGQADGWSSKSVVVFAIPLLMLAVQWLCVLVTARDPGNRDRNRKLQALVLWIIPLLSNLVCGISYALALGLSFSITGIMTVFMGILFMVIGNYMPKCRMNATIGIKVPWTYTSEDNWNATHRFGGKVWFLGGLFLALCGLLPGSFGVSVTVISLLVLSVLPVVYSWLYYRRQKKAGGQLQSAPPALRRYTRHSLLILIPVLALTGWLMFTGDITVSYDTDAFTVEASFHQDLTVEYAAIDSIEFRRSDVDGVRVLGFASARLLLGQFENGEFGTYTRYTYTDPEACIILTVGENTLVLSSKTASQTKAIYLDLLDMTGLE